MASSSLPFKVSFLDTFSLQSQDQGNSSNSHNQLFLSRSGEMISRLPKGICSIKGLTKLDLSSNLLTTLPDCFGQLHKLQVLNLTWNKISTFNTPSLETLHDLRELYLGFNTLVELPECIGHLTNLTILEANDNSLKELPKSFQYLKNLKVLKLHFNAIHILHSDFGQLVEHLVELTLMGNPLESPKMSIIMQGTKALQEHLNSRQHQELEKRLQNADHRHHVEAGRPGRAFQSNDVELHHNSNGLHQEDKSTSNKKHVRDTSVSHSSFLPSIIDDVINDIRTESSSADRRLLKSKLRKERSELSEPVKSLESTNSKRQLPSNFSEVDRQSSMTKLAALNLTPPRPRQHVQRNKTNPSHTVQNVGNDFIQHDVPANFIQLPKPGQECRISGRNIRNNIASYNSSMNQSTCVRENFPIVSRNSNVNYEAQRQNFHGILINNRETTRAINHNTHVRQVSHSNARLISNRTSGNDLTLEDVSVVRQLLQNRNPRLLASLEPCFDTVATTSMTVSEDRIVSMNQRENNIHNTSLDKINDALSNARSRADLPENNDPTMPRAFLCPITLLVMVDPVVLSDGHTYERLAIMKWLETNSTSPMTGQELVSLNVTPNFSIKSMICEHLEKMKVVYSKKD